MSGCTAYDCEFVALADVSPSATGYGGSPDSEDVSHKLAISLKDSCETELRSRTLTPVLAIAT